MKQRIISAAVAVAICIYPLLFGGISLNILMILIGMIGCYEFVNCIKKPLNYILLIIMEATYLFNVYSSCLYLIISTMMKFMMVLFT